MIEVTMPRLSDSMEEGTVVRWLRQEGDAVSAGDELVEIETDKATMAYEAEAEGRLSIVVAEGDTVPLGGVIGHLLSGAEVPVVGEDAPGAVPPAVTGAPVPASADPASADPGTADRAPAARPAAHSAAAVPRPATGAARVRASPLARRIAADLGVDLSGVSGTGPSGRVVRRDVEAAAATAVPERGPTASPRDGDASAADVTRIALTSMQRVVARRMSESHATVPDFAVDIEVAMDEAMALRTALGDLDDRGAPSYNDMVVRAVALALREHPRVNSSYDDDGITLHDRVHVGVAVAVVGGLLVPTIRDADAKSLADIAEESRALAEACRAGTITPQALQGGTFTVSNLGMLGVSAFTAVVNPPQAAILAVGALRQEPVVRDGAVVVGHRVTLRMSCDHRVVYGADAARFVAHVRDLLQRPLALLR